MADSGVFKPLAHARSTGGTGTKEARTSRQACRSMPTSKLQSSRSAFCRLPRGDTGSATAASEQRSSSSSG